MNEGVDAGAALGGAIAGRSSGQAPSALAANVDGANRKADKLGTTNGKPCATCPCPAETLKANVLKCEMGTVIWDKAKAAIGKDPAVTVGPTKTGFAGETNTETGAITIKPDKCCEATQVLAFELTNATSKQRFRDVRSKASAGDLSREEFGRANEQIEYEGLFTSVKAFDACKKNWGCGGKAKSSDAWVKDYKDFMIIITMVLIRRIQMSIVIFGTKPIKASIMERILEGEPLHKSRRWVLAAFPLTVGGLRVRAGVIAMPDLKRTIEDGASRLSFRLGSLDWEFIRISPGEFQMGAAADEQEAEDDEKPARLVRITRPFYFGKCQVTENQYESVMMHKHRSSFYGENLPVHHVKYREALDFCRKMSSAAGVLVSLPTEAQWEYAYRAGTTTIYYSGNSVADLKRIAWYEENSEGRLHPVGQKQPNAWGLHDMSGNVYEPCLDYISSADFPVDDPIGTRSPDRGIARGGAWGTLARACRASARILTNDRLGALGLRVAINPH